MSEIAVARKALEVARALTQTQPHELDLAFRKLGIEGFSPETIDPWQYDSYCHSLVGSLAVEQLEKLANLFGVRKPESNGEKPKNGDSPNSKLFISYQSDDAQKAGDLATTLRKYGFEAFVAHDDIEKGTEWRRQLQSNLNNADAIICLVGSKYPSSAMCNQEIGWALARNIPVIPCLLNREVKPSQVGFAEEFQFFRFRTAEQLARETLIHLFSLGNVGSSFVSHFVDLVGESPDFERLLMRWGLLKTIPTLPDEALTRLKLASEQNPQFGRVNQGTFKPIMMKTLDTWNQPSE